MSFEKQCRAVCARIIHSLQAEREKQGLSKYALSQRSGLSQTTIANLERQVKIPSIETIVRYAAGLEIDLADIVRRAWTDNGPRARAKS